MLNIENQKLEEQKKLEKFVEKFNEIKSLGWIKSTRSHNTGIGKTFEDLLEKSEDNLSEPDFHGFEIKSQRNYSESYVTLCTKSPTYPPRSNSLLRQKYGYSDEKHPDLKILHTSVFYGKVSNNAKSGFGFSLKIDEEKRLVYLLVLDNCGNIINNDIYYTFSDIESALKKLNRLAFVTAETKNTADGEEFHFNKAIVFSGLKSIDHFILMLKNQDIMYDIRIGAYKTGKNRGKTHDHGSGFRIKKNKMQELYLINKEIT